MHIETLVARILKIESERTKTVKLRIDGKSILVNSRVTAYHLDTLLPQIQPQRKLYGVAEEGLIYFKLEMDVSAHGQPSERLVEEHKKQSEIFDAICCEFKADDLIEITYFSTIRKQRQQLENQKGEIDYKSMPLIYYPLGREKTLFKPSLAEVIIVKKV